MGTAQEIVMEDKINKIIGIACEKGDYRWKIDVTMESMILDPLFWQALSKACGWDKTVCVHCGAVITYGEDTLSENIHCDHKNYKYREKKWENIAIRFYEINLIESFDEAINWLLDLIK